MREIEFRGKKLDNGEWVYGVPFEDFDGNMLIGNYGSKVKVIPDTISEFTGLEDKSGTRIFEGDIIKNDWCFMSIIRFGEYKPFNMSNNFRQGHLGYYVEALSESEKKLYRKDILYYADKCEVIGNIFDNPELLKGGE